MSNEIVILDQIRHRIFTLRGHRILLDADLAAFYGVATKVFNQAVQRNAARFPADFRFQLTREELANLKSQIVTSSAHASDGEQDEQSLLLSRTPARGHGGVRKLPWAFTEHGALMAGMVLNSPRATQVSLIVVRAFVELRRLIVNHLTLAEKLRELDARVGAHDEQLAAIIDAIRQLTAAPEPEDRPKIGFHEGNR